jgi:hypothetical protein
MMSPQQLDLRVLTTRVRGNGEEAETKDKTATTISESPKINYFGPQNLTGFLAGSQSNCI